MPQVIGIPKETFPEEKRVATVPDVVAKLIKLGFSVSVQSGAGDAANFADDTYRAAGAEVVGSAAELWAKSDIVFKVRPPSAAEVALMREGGTLIGFIWPAQNPELMQQLAAKKATVLAIDALPRQLSRAQKMDALTSMAGVSGPTPNGIRIATDRGAGLPRVGDEVLVADEAFGDHAIMRVVAVTVGRYRPGFAECLVALEEGDRRYDDLSEEEQDAAWRGLTHVGEITAEEAEEWTP